MVLVYAKELNIMILELLKPVSSSIRENLLTEINTGGGAMNKVESVLTDCLIKSNNY